MRQEIRCISAPMWHDVEDKRGKASNTCGPNTGHFSIGKHFQVNNTTLSGMLAKTTQKHNQ